MTNGSNTVAVARDEDRTIKQIIIIAHFIVKDFNDFKTNVYLGQITKKLICVVINLHSLTLRGEGGGSYLWYKLLKKYKFAELVGIVYY